LVAEIVPMVEVPMTPAQQATLEQAARAVLGEHYECEDRWYSCPLSTEGCYDATEPKECNCGLDDKVKRLTDLLAAQRAAVLEEAALHAGERQATWIEPVNALNRSTQFGIERYAKAEEARYFKDWLRAQAKEQRP
jgi:hypothetical protein